MAFETSVLQNGEWTTRTLDVNTVLRHYDQQDQQSTANSVEVERAPVLGLLTQTVIRSPVVHWILPLKLRDPDTNDVAFIGDEFVQIRELRPDGHMWDVIRKDNFGARIRNARVIGSTEAFIRDREQRFQSTQVKDEEDLDDMDIDIMNRDSPNGSLLPPQAILLQLDSGDSVFLMLHQSGNGTLKFVSSRHRASRSMLKLQPGAHLAVDPSSRYMVIGCSEGLFAIYALKSRMDLQEQSSRGSPLHYVEAERYISLQGVIHKIEFLHPSSDDEEHVILLVLMIRKGKTRMLLYEWETGGDLREVRAHNRRGHLLEEARQMPLLLVPLTIKSAFILVSATTMSICRDILHGSPRFIDIDHLADPPTALFHGWGVPLWTSWARPVREPYYMAGHDDIYIVREDGFVKFIETDCDEEDLVKTEMNIGQLSCNCGPALACLDYKLYNDETGDLLVTSGDSCAGGAYLVKAREAPTFIESIQNWSPAHDFVTDSLDEKDLDDEQNPTAKYYRELVPRPDRIFGCAGKGASGSITEFRHGLEASIGLEMSYDAQIMDIWVLSSEMEYFDGDEGSLFLLSLGDRSSVLHLSSDATEIVELEPQSTKFDLTSRTIAAIMHEQYRIQVTEKSIVFVNGANVQTLSKVDLLGVHEKGSFVGCGEKVDLAVVHENTVLFTTRIGLTSYLQMIELRQTVLTSNDPLSGLSDVRNIGRYSSDATCLSIGLVAQSLCAIIAEYDEGIIRFLFQPLTGMESRTLQISHPINGHHLHLEHLVSLAVVPGSPGHILIICGTRNGILVTLEIDETSFQIARSWYDKIGATLVTVKKDEYSSLGGIVFVTCDLKLYALMVPVAGLPSGSPGKERKISQIFLTDALNPITRQPQINTIARLRPTLSGGTDSGILLVSGSQIFLAGLSHQPKAVPRHLPIQGSPSRLLYSHHLGCLIVAASVNGRCTLLFIDPDTGEDLSSPIDKKNGNSVQFVSGLGNLNERIFRLFEWGYVKGGKTWRFLIVCTSTGRLLIVSTQRGETVESRGSELIFNQQYGNKIRYWTLHKIRCGQPLYSVAGFNEGLFYCSGETLYCETLDMVGKRFKRVAEYELPSPALNLAFREGNLYALTAGHSLEVLKIESGASLDAANGPGLKITRTHGDQVTRNTLHHRIISQSGQSPLNLVSDKSCSVVGLWATHKAKADTLEAVFEAQLPCSILRLRNSKSRPTWDAVWQSDNGIDIGPNSATYPETLGMSIDGSLFNFTVVDFAAWKFLRFLVNLAKQSPQVCEFTYTHDDLSLDPVPDPKLMMHVDGDILRRCLDGQSLDDLLGTGQGSVEAEATQAKFTELLQGLHRGKLERNVAMSCYVKQAYKDLEFFLRPVL